MKYVKKNEDKILNDDEFGFFAAGVTWDVFAELLVFDFLLKSDCIYKPLAENVAVTVSRCLKDEQINIAAMTKGNKVNSEYHFYQTIIFKDSRKYPLGELYFLIPKIQNTSEFTRSIPGIDFQIDINKKYGDELLEFPINYVAQGVINYPLFDRARPESSLGLINTLCQELFTLWEPRWGPQEHMMEHDSEIIAFRVYEISEDMRNYIRNYRGRVPSVEGGVAQVTIKQPILSEHKFRFQQVELLKILLVD